MARIVADMHILQGNVRVLARHCRVRGMRLLPVLKGVEAWPPMAAACLAEGVQRVAVSSMAQAGRLLDAGQERPVMLGLPPLSQVALVTARTCRSLVSTVEAAQALASQALLQQVSHRVLLMVDLGDGREGCRPEEALGLAQAIRSLAHPWFGLDGVAANFGCLVEAPPARESLEALIAVVEAVGRREGEAGEVSLGGSVLLPWLPTHVLPPCVTELRLGYALLLGDFMGADCCVPGLRPDGFFIAAEVLEARGKQVGKQTIRQRIVLDLGLLEVTPGQLVPVDPGLRLVGASSDYLIYDVEDCPRRFAPGEEVLFRPGYEALARAFHSCSVKKPYNVGAACPEPALRA